MNRLRWSSLPAREIRPAGWLHTQLKEDFERGLIGHLDKINKDVSVKLLGKQSLGLDSEGAPSWWPAEQEGYWFEAYTHAAFFLKDAKAIDYVTEYVEAILDSQKEDGYLGIYAPESRLGNLEDANFGKLSGELHTLARVSLILLAFHEHTGRTDALKAVERSTQLIIDRYPKGIFGACSQTATKEGGYSHGISFLDPLLQLYRLTGDDRYLRYVEAINKSYNAYPPRDRDLIDHTLDDEQARFHAHGVHTAESLALHPALSLLDLPESERRTQATIEKLQRHLTPGGAMVSNELIAGQLGSGMTPYEYCCQAELMKSLLWISQCSGKASMGSAAARLFFNSIQGARMHPLAALQYLSRDDRTDIRSHTCKNASTISGSENHFQMSSIIRPTCCTASAGRPIAAFISGMWAKGQGGETLAVLYFGPSEVQTQVKGVHIRICEETAYPFSDTVSFSIDPVSPVAFDLALPLPVEGTLSLIDPDQIETREQDGFLYLRKEWSSGDRITLKLDLPVVLEATVDNRSRYYRRGDLVYALPFPTEIDKVSENPNYRDGRPSGFFEYDIRVKNRSQWGLRVDPQITFAAVRLSDDLSDPWNKPCVGLQGKMVNPQGDYEHVTLVPEGTSLSRRVTFLDTSRSAAEANREELGSQESIGW